MKTPFEKRIEEQVLKFALIEASLFIDFNVQELEEKEKNNFNDFFKKIINKSIELTLKEVEEKIENIETQYPSEEGEPFDITIEEFKEELKKRLRE